MDLEPPGSFGPNPPPIAQWNRTPVPVFRLYLFILDTVLSHLSRLWRPFTIPHPLYRSLILHRVSTQTRSASSCRVISRLLIYLPNQSRVAVLRQRESLMMVRLWNKSSQHDIFSKRSFSLWSPEIIIVEDFFVVCWGQSCSRLSSYNLPDNSD